ncbi:1-(5-phosphoribosyl)-5-[(5-phosphoribosylamino)methylideneamino]imidazole-4-carboxamide isomerase [Chryseobacterium chendengshani]|uniref:1-(5-phosphoribosyl)-5-[(5- phosphoribosylamino)methylideneamino]imidazole-4- carboxamide isomerase n=1 Tax=unclassified Chryseobacterium TaxID=2593645 RepID=UPI001C63D53B|nr:MULTISPECIES: 1-(5-phosphoribosyl)-5-[(5-phosphoribosylamino)methylideneamino]imidazole-4-carboxamide isomerase [unclassified Chryseobacterium]MBW7674510.1 1-(5-phosphoribosyl)-5-[(5-phosphoribosylamino)methylideneamino]imidazole-4-carboxamide isomerase [Chryseobacterium sp. LJ756]MBW8522698.1 1-(5-phosphoribosyl)-5-[(5-phosphoribosylamino)methylideneamino]imidazole-4-carboxamide isomerase [Chryseobacterium sp. LJ668]QYK16232.1 1-(5-phosphoribosyl)-5-[(5-phosphoribosylamino)methylideneamino]i
MKIIPAIDIIDGKCVRLSKGDYSTKKIYNENPVEVATEFEDFGIKFLHLVDLDGAKSKHIINQKVLERIATKTSLQIDFGGGLKTEKDIEIAFNSGADQITIGSIAVQNPEFCYEIIKKYGSEKIILGADCENRQIKTSGWLEESNRDIIDFILQYQEKNIRNVICTDISKDGMLEGASTELYQEILAKTEIQLVASGGISCIDDVFKMKEIGCSGTIIGKAIYENKISLNQLKNFIEHA